MLNKNGETITVQKQHLILSVMEAYSIWKSKHLKLVAGKPKFVSLHPKNVLLTSKLPQNVCLCKHHRLPSLNSHFLKDFRIFLCEILAF